MHKKCVAPPPPPPPPAHVFEHFWQLHYTFCRIPAASVSIPSVVEVNIGTLDCDSLNGIEGASSLRLSTSPTQVRRACSRLRDTIIIERESHAKLAEYKWEHAQLLGACEPLCVHSWGSRATEQALIPIPFFTWGHLTLPRHLVYTIVP